MATSDNKTLGGDDRLKKTLTPDSRTDRASADSERTDKDGTAFSVGERRTNFRDEWSANALPTPPAIPGFHLCWLSTTNSYDPIHKRMRMGYEPVKSSELHGFEIFKVKSGEYEGLVGCNEMLLFKIEDSLYQEMMSYFHHEKPLESELMIRQSLPSDRNTRSVGVGDEDGLGLLGKAPRSPKFA